MAGSVSNVGGSSNNSVYTDAPQEQAPSQRSQRSQWNYDQGSVLESLRSINRSNSGRSTGSAGSQDFQSARDDSLSSGSSRKSSSSKGSSKGSFAGSDEIGGLIQRDAASTLVSHLPQNQTPDPAQDSFSFRPASRLSSMSYKTAKTSFSRSTSQGGNVVKNDAASVLSSHLPQRTASEAVGDDHASVHTNSTSSSNKSSGSRGVQRPPGFQRSFEERSYSWSSDESKKSGSGRDRAFKPASQKSSSSSGGSSVGRSNVQQPPGFRRSFEEHSYSWSSDESDKGNVVKNDAASVLSTHLPQQQNPEAFDDHVSVHTISGSSSGGSSGSRGSRGFGKLPPRPAVSTFQNSTSGSDSSGSGGLITREDRRRMARQQEQRSTSGVSNASTKQPGSVSDAASKLSSHLPQHQKPEISESENEQMAADADWPSIYSHSPSSVERNLKDAVSFVSTEVESDYGWTRRVKTRELRDNNRGKGTNRFTVESNASNQDVASVLHSFISADLPKTFPASENQPLPSNSSDGFSHTSSEVLSDLRLHVDRASTDDSAVSDGKGDQLEDATRGFTPSHFHYLPTDGATRRVREYTSFYDSGPYPVRNVPTITRSEDSGAPPDRIAPVRTESEASGPAPSYAPPLPPNWQKSRRTSLLRQVFSKKR